MFEIVSPVETVVLKSLFAQCVKGSGIFIPDSMEAQKYLFSIGVLPKCRLGTVEWAEVIEGLTNKGIVKSDRIVDADFLKTYYAKHFPGQQPPIRPNTKFYWLHETDWAYKILQFGGLVGIEDVQKKYGCCMFVKMNMDDMYDIEEKYMASHTVYLKLDVAKCCLCVRFDKESKWRELTPHMNPNAVPFKILQAASKKANKEVTAKELGFKAKYLNTKVFAKTKVVKALSPLLIELTRDSITFKTSAKVSQAQFECLKKDLKIS